MCAHNVSGHGIGCQAICTPYLTSSYGCRLERLILAFNLPDSIWGAGGGGAVQGSRQKRLGLYCPFCQSSAISELLIIMPYLCWLPSPCHDLGSLATALGLYYEPGGA